MVLGLDVSFLNGPFVVPFQFLQGAIVQSFLETLFAEFLYSVLQTQAKVHQLAKWPLLVSLVILKLVREGYAWIHTLRGSHQHKANIESVHTQTTCFNLHGRKANWSSCPEQTCSISSLSEHTMEGTPEGGGRTWLRFRTRAQATSFSFWVSVSQFSIRLSSPSSDTTHTSFLWLALLRGGLAQWTSPRRSMEQCHSNIHAIYGDVLIVGPLSSTLNDSPPTGTCVPAPVPTSGNAACSSHIKRVKYACNNHPKMLCRQLPPFETGCAPTPLRSWQAQVRTRCL